LYAVYHKRLGFVCVTLMAYKACYSDSVGVRSAGARITNKTENATEQNATEIRPKINQSINQM